MDLRIENDVAVVVGAASGIGWAIAEAFATEGARVALVDREPTVVDRAEQLAAAHAVAAAGFVADITDYATLLKTAAAVARRFGGIRHVVHAAAIGSGKFGFPFWNLQPADWPKVLEVNVTGAVNVVHAFRAALVQSGEGSLILLSSVAGQIGSQTDPPYSASKAALINFMQCAAKDLAPMGVRVNCICPGMVQTSLNRSVWEAWRLQQPPETRLQTYEEWSAEKIARVVPLGRWQEPQDIADMAVFLASRRARNVTGQTINVDGGFVMR